MYNKIVLASAIALASGGASAATWTTDLGAAPVEHTIEGLDKGTESTGVQVSNAIVRLGTQYSLNDQITFTYNVAKATGYSWPSALYSVKSGGSSVNELVGTEATGQTVFATEVRASGTTAQVTGFAIGDICTIQNDATNLSHRIVDIDTSAKTITVNPAVGSDAGADGDDITCDTKQYIVLGLVDGTSATAPVYRVTSLAGSGSTVGSEIAAPAPMVSHDGLAATKTMTVGFSAATAAGVAMDQLATTTNIATASSEYTYTLTTKFNGVIDVENAKKDYASGFDGATTEDDLVLTLALDAGTIGEKKVVSNVGVLTATSDSTAATNVAIVKTAASTEITTVNADFTWLDDAVAAGITADVSGITSDLTNNSIDADTLNATGTSFTANSGHSGGLLLAGVKTITLKNTEAAVIPAQSFSGQTVISYTSYGIAGTETYTWADLGTTTLNGASVTAYAVPMGTAVSRFLWVNNSGSAAAVLDYSVTMNGSTYGPYSLTTVAGKTAASVGALIDADLSNRSVFVAPTSRANISITAPVKANDITISASYKHEGDSDRLGLETSDSLTALDGK